VAIVALVLYVITAAAGVSLLGTGGAARRRAAEAEAAVAAGAGAAGTEEAGAGAEALAPAEAGRVATQTTSAAAEAVRAPGLQARLAAVPLTADGKPPPGPRVKVAAPPGEHPLLEFSHPALAITGLACWFMYVFVRYTPFAWISFGILMVAITIGLTWLVHNTRAARRRLKGAWHFPPRLVLLHGTAAAVAILLSVLTALSASHV
jgi:Flp pilus assembly protein TadB